MTRLVLALLLTGLALIATSCGGSGPKTVTVAGTSMPSTTTRAASTQPKEVETPEQVIAALKSAGLPIGAFRSYTASTDPNELLGRPGQYTGKANFRDRRLTPTKDFDTTSGGSVETFENRDDAKQRYDYVSALAKGSALFVEYDYLEGNTLLRLSPKLTPAQAKVYEEAFREAL